VTSIGVFPARESSNIEGLKVVMEGKPADEDIDHTLAEMEKVCSCRFGNKTNVYTIYLQ
jgi:hypothetical protein